MMTRISAVLALALLCGCVTLPAPTAQDVRGEWRFVYAQKTLSMFGHDFIPPPSFDAIEFLDGGRIRLADSMRRREFAGDYTLVGNKLAWSFSPPDVKEPIKHQLDCSWTENGQALMLRLAKDVDNESSQVEWVYYKSNRFLSNSAIAGKWVAKAGDGTADMTFEKDGRYYMDGRKVWGYYRLWQSRYGSTLTTPIWIQEEGAFVVLYLYHIDADSLTLTPLTPSGPEKKGRTVFKRMTEDSASNKVSEATSPKRAAPQD
jgi:hypothetical protein